MKDLFNKRPYPLEYKPEVEKLIAELIKIGKTDDFLSERPGNPFNIKCRHIRAREIGERLYEIGSISLMEYAYNKVTKKLGNNLGSHLEYAWSEIGNWLS